MDCDRHNGPPKMSMPSSLEPVSMLLHGKRNFVAVIKVMELKTWRLF